MSFQHLINEAKASKKINDLTEAAAELAKGHPTEAKRARRYAQLAAKSGKDGHMRAACECAARAQGLPKTLAALSDAIREPEAKKAPAPAAPAPAPKPTPRTKTKTTPKKEA